MLFTTPVVFKKLQRKLVFPILDKNILFHNELLSKIQPGEILPAQMITPFEQRLLVFGFQ